MCSAMAAQGLCPVHGPLTKPLFQDCSESLLWCRSNEALQALHLKLHLWMPAKLANDAGCQQRRLVRSSSPDSALTLSAQACQADEQLVRIHVDLADSGGCGAQVNPNIKKEKWTEEEDDRLLELVRVHGNAWAEISRQLDGRTDQQCMGRWRRHLDPAIKREQWAAPEDAALASLHARHGSQWSAISKSIDGRTAQQCRARCARPRVL